MKKLGLPFYLILLLWVVSNFAWLGAYVVCSSHKYELKNNVEGQVSIILMLKEIVSVVYDQEGFSRMVAERYKSNSIYYGDSIISIDHIKFVFYEGKLVLVEGKEEF